LTYQEGEGQPRDRTGQHSPPETKDNIDPR
jgi:hypothetical protein